MTTQKTLLATVLALAVAGSALLFLGRDPESLHVASADGRFLVEGLGTAPDAWRVVRRDDLVGPFTAAVPPMYDLGDGVSSSQPLDLSMEVPEGNEGATLTLANYDSALSAWRPVPTAFDPASGRLLARVLRASGLWAAMRPFAPEIPDAALGSRNELLAFPPTGAVGYRLSALVSTTGNDFVLLTDALERGGCDGVFHSGASRTQTSADRRVDGVVYRLVAQWELASGCADGARMRAQ